MIATNANEIMLKIDEDSPPPTAPLAPECNAATELKDEQNGSLGRNNSYFFGDDPPSSFLDPPSKLIGEFLRHQRVSGNCELDPEVQEEVTFWGSQSPSNKGSFKDRSLQADECEPISRAPFSRASTMKSRMIDQRSGNIFRSGILKQPPPPNAPDASPTPSNPPEDDPLDIPENHPSRSACINRVAIFEWVMLVLGIGALVCTTHISPLQQRKLLGLHLWRWVSLGLVVLCGHLFSGWIIWLIVFVIERNFIMRKRVVYFVYGLQKGAQNCLWFGIVLLAWRLIFDPNLPLPIRKERKALQIVTKILVCLLVAASLWLIKILLVKVLALNFHVSTYFDRIQETLFNQYILEALSGPPLLEQEQADQNAENVDAARKSQVLRKSGNIGVTGMSIEHLQRLNQKNVSAWNMKRLIRLAKSSRITPLAQNLELGEEVTPGESKNTDVESEWQTKITAKHIFNNVAGKKSSCRYLTLCDLMRFLGEEEVALKAFSLFDGASESGKITKQSLVNWVANVHRERRALSFSLNDTKTAVNKLHRIIDAIMAIIILIIWLLILGIATTHLLVALSSQLVLAVFVFGNTCKTIFEAIIFLFVMHPFDVGDRCVIDGVQMVVEEMNILTTVFLRYDNEKIYYPNSVLATKPISNFYRSPDMGDAIEFSIHISTSNEKLEALKGKIKKYIDSHLHHWYPKHDLVMKEIEDMNRIRMALWLQHTMNHQNAGEKWVRRSQLLFYLKDSFQELEIDYQLLPQEVKLKSL